MPLILAHRGYHRELPENTMASFEAAVKLGVDGIETDLRWSADGKIVLFHDRLAPDPVPAKRREVRTYTVAELTKAAGYATPTVEEALDAFPGVLWNLEIKEPEVLPALLPVLQRYKATHRLLVSSFWHPAVEAVKQAVDVECGLLTAHRPIDPVSERLGRFSDNRTVDAFVWHYDYLSPELVTQAAAIHAKNYVYSAHTRQDHAHAIACGVDGIITDDPPLARELLNTRPARN